MCHFIIGTVYCGAISFVLMKCVACEATQFLVHVLSLINHCRQQHSKWACIPYCTPANGLLYCVFSACLQDTLTRSHKMTIAHPPLTNLRRVEIGIWGIPAFKTLTKERSVYCISSSTCHHLWVLCTNGKMGFGTFKVGAQSSGWWPHCFVQNLAAPPSCSRKLWGEAFQYFMFLSHDCCLGAGKLQVGMLLSASGKLGLTWPTWLVLLLTHYICFLTGLLEMTLLGFYALSLLQVEGRADNRSNMSWGS